MAQNFSERAHLNINKEKFDEGYKKIFGEKNMIKGRKEKQEKTCFKCKKKTNQYEMFHGMFYYCTDCI